MKAEPEYMHNHRPTENDRKVSSDDKYSLVENAELTIISIDQDPADAQSAAMPTDHDLIVAESKRANTARDILNKNILSLDQGLTTNTLLKKYWQNDSNDINPFEELAGINLITEEVSAQLRKDISSLDFKKLITKNNKYAGICFSFSAMELLCCKASVMFSSPALTLLFYTVCGLIGPKLFVLCCARSRLSAKLDQYDSELANLKKLQILRKRIALPDVRDYKGEPLSRQKYNQYIKLKVEIDNLVNERDAINQLIIEIENDINRLKKTYGIKKPSAPVMTRIDNDGFRVPQLVVEGIGQNDEKTFQDALRSLSLNNEGCNNIDVREVLLTNMKLFCIVGAGLGCCLDNSCRKNQHSKASRSCLASGAK